MLCGTVVQGCTSTVLHLPMAAFAPTLSSQAQVLNQHLMNGERERMCVVNALAAICGRGGLPLYVSFTSRTAHAANVTNPLRLLHSYLLIC